MNYKKELRLFLVLSYVFMLIFATSQTVNSDISFVGKLAEDGTRLYFTYWNPFAQVVSPSGQILYNGSEMIIYEGSTVTYQEVYVYFAFSNSTTKECLYNMTFYYTFYNETAERIMTENEPYENLRRVVISQGADYVKDTINLPVHEQLVYIEVNYLNIRFGFFHKTFEGVIPQEYTEYDMRWQALKNTLWVFLTVVLAGGLTAFALVQKAGNFDLGWHWAFMIPLIIFQGFLFYATYLFYVSLKELVYLFPYWAVLFTAFAMTVVILVNLFNTIRGRSYIRCDKYDTKGMTVETHMIPVDRNETKYMEEGFKASCIRLFSLKNRKYENSLQFGTFSNVEIDHYVEVSDNQDKINKKVEKLKGEGWIYKGAIASDQEGKKELHFIKNQQVFEPSDVTPRWFWTPKGRGYFTKSFMVKHLEPTRATINIRSLWWLPSGSLCVFNLLFGFLYQDENRTLDSALKISLWVVFGILFLFTVGVHSVAGGYQIEVDDSHVAMSIVSACSHLNQAKVDGETIAELKANIEKLRTTRYIDALAEGERQSSSMIKAVMHYVENEIIPELEEEKT